MNESIGSWFVEVLEIGCLSGMVGAYYAGYVWQSRPEMERAVCRWMQPVPPRFLDSSLAMPWVMARRASLCDREPLPRYSGTLSWCYPIVACSAW